MNQLRRKILWLAFPLLAVLSVACDGMTISRPPCPTPPAIWTVGTGSSKLVLDPKDYPIAPRAAQTSIDIELGQLYMRRRIEASLEAPSPDNPNPGSGVFVDDVRLEEQGSGPQKVNLVTIRITPWLRGASGQPASLQRSYRMGLNIVPYLITPATVADEQKRRAFLRTTDRGAALRFELIELYSIVNQEAVSCSSANYDLIDSNVLTGLYDSLDRQDPLVLPAVSLTAMADTMLSSTTSLAGMNVGSDLDLKIGLTLDQGTPSTFDPQTSLPHFPSADWGVRLSTSFVSAAIERTARQAATGADPAVSVDSVSVSYVPGGIDVTVRGALNKCGTIRWTDEAHVTPLVRMRTDGKFILVAPSTDKMTNDAGLLNVVCVALDQVFQSLANPLGRATATINQFGVCGFPMSRDPVEFDAGPNDHFYATAVDTDELFYVAGRSTFMDQIVGARPPVPSCP